MGLTVLSRLGARRWIAFLAVATVTAAATAVPGQDVAGVASGAKLPTPEFKSDAGAKEYTRALRLFEEDKYRDAGKGFVRAKRHAKSAADKKVLEAWSEACEGGKALQKLAKMASSRARAKDALFGMIDAAARYRGTPVEPKFDSVIKELSDKLLTVLDDFDSRHRASKIGGRTFIAVDPEKPGAVAVGKGCIEWAQTKKKTVRAFSVKNVPSDWTKYEGIVFWVYAIRPTSIDVVADNSAKGADKTRHFMTARHTPKAKRRWERVYIPLDKFKKSGSGSFEKVSSLIFSIGNTPRDFQVRLDHVCLIKGGAASPRKKR